MLHLALRAYIVSSGGVGGVSFSLIRKNIGAAVNMGDDNSKNIVAPEGTPDPAPELRAPKYCIIHNTLTKPRVLFNPGNTRALRRDVFEYTGRRALRK